MKKLDIKITKAALKSFSVEMGDEKPSVSATISLLTEGGKQITEYSIRTEAWNEKDKFELPFSCIAPIISIAKDLENIVTKHCRDSQKGISAKCESNSKMPTNLTDISF